MQGYKKRNNKFSLNIFDSEKKFYNDFNSSGQVFGLISKFVTDGTLKDSKYQFSCFPIQN